MLKIGPSFVFFQILQCLGVCLKHENVNWCQNGVLAKLSGYQKHKEKLKMDIKKQISQKKLFLRLVNKYEKVKTFFVFAKIAWQCLPSGRQKNGILVHTICFGHERFWAQNSQTQETFTLQIGCLKPIMNPFF